MVDKLYPTSVVDDGRVAQSWYERLGFVVIGEHRFEPGLPLYVFLRRDGIDLHLSEHLGDAPPASVAYFYVDDVDFIAAQLDPGVRAQPWGREIELTDSFGNSLRIGTVRSASE